MRSLMTVVSLVALLAAGCAMAPKAGAPAPAEQTPPPTSKAPQTSSSGSK